MGWNYNKLRGKIKETCGTQESFAEKIGISYTSLSKRLNNQIEFTQEDIYKSCEVLNISMEQVPEYFFTLIV